MGLVATLGVYFLALRLQRRVKSPFVNPVLVSTLVLVVALVLLHVPYEVYQRSADWLTRLLEPSVVALAVPLYRHWPSLRQRAGRIARACLLGVSVAMAANITVNLLLRATREVAISTLPRAVTTPIALAISAVIGGRAALTVVSVIVAGVMGAAFGPACSLASG